LKHDSTDDTLAAGRDAPEPGGERRLELAARAAWLQYDRRLTQEQIAVELSVSRQVVQRLIALAHAERMVRFQILHPLAECIELAGALKARYGLQYCEVAVTQRGATEDTPAAALLAALYLETVLEQKTPTTIAVGNGKTMREVSRRLRPMNRPQHSCVSMMGNLARDGRAGVYDVVTWLSDRVKAQCYPLPLPVITNSVAEREVLQAQPGYAILKDLVRRASIAIMGIGYWQPQSSLFDDGFISESELAQATAAGAVGELLGFAIDRRGDLVDANYHARLTSSPLQVSPERPTIIVASGTMRMPAVRAALTGKLANGLIIDENSARLLLGPGHGTP
jgi:DNA-binding transcriptional regulator LsrR (DeoR family)